MLRIMNELQEILGDKTKDIPSNPTEIPKVFARWIETTLLRNKRSKIVIVRARRVFDFSKENYRSWTAWTVWTIQ